MPKFEVAYLSGFSTSEVIEIEEIALVHLNLLIKNGINILENKYDFLESIIFNEGLFIQNIDFHKDVDLMLIVLNSNAVLQQKISSYPSLVKATADHINNYQLMAGATGVHWPDLDEDLSLKGFLEDEIIKIIKNDGIAA